MWQLKCFDHTLGMQPTSTTTTRASSNTGMYVSVYIHEHL